MSGFKVPPLPTQQSEHTAALEELHDAAVEAVREHNQASRRASEARRRAQQALTRYGALLLEASGQMRLDLDAKRDDPKREVCPECLEYLDDPEQGCDACAHVTRGT